MVPRAENHRLSARSLMFLRLSGSVERWVVPARHLQVLQSPSSCRYLTAQETLAFHWTTRNAKYPNAPNFVVFCNLPDPNGVFRFWGAGWVG